MKAEMTTDPHTMMEKRTNLLEPPKLAMNSARSSMTPTSLMDAMTTKRPVKRSIVS